VTEPGDSGGPVYLDRNERQLVGVVAGIVGGSRANVPTDVYVPLVGRNRDWIIRELGRKDN
jgi:V8-like Glu-specific endopeptidase